MANKSVFASIKGRLLPKATARNAHAAPAYAYSDAHALAQVAVTGTFGGMFYQSPQEELEYVLDVAEAVEPVFLATRLASSSGDNTVIENGSLPLKPKSSVTVLKSGYSGLPVGSPPPLIVAPTAPDLMKLPCQPPIRFGLVSFGCVQKPGSAIA